MDNSDTLGVLKQLEQGEITAAQADEKLNAPPPAERADAPRVEPTRAPAWARGFWVYALIAGMITVGIGAWIVVATVNANALWFLCGLPIVLIGSLVLAFAATMQSAHWVYVNVQSAGRRKRNVRFGIPFPFGLVRLGLWIAHRFKPHLRAKVNVRTSRTEFDAVWESAEEFLNAIERELKENRPLTVDVEDKNERVQVYIV